jgi:radical SAM-linked protein
LTVLVELPPRLRIRYIKQGRIRYTSQRDVARAFERMLRRGQLPAAYSEGFSPRPLLSFSLALPTGCESLAEYADLRFSAASELPGGPQVRAGLNRAELALLASHLGELLPEGLSVVAAAELTGSEGSLQEEVTSCDWIVEVTGMSAVELECRISSVLGATKLPVERERKGRRVSDDLRPGILHLDLEGPGASPGTLRLHAELATKPRGVRPSELLSAISPAVRLVRASRTAQWIAHDGQKLEPLRADGLLLGAVDPVTVGGR